MATKKSRNKQVSRRIYVAKVKKLKRAGLLQNVDPRKKPTPAILGVLTKYKDVLTGRSAVVKARDKNKASEIRKRLGLRGSGNTIIVPREKGEKIRITKGGEIKSTRKRYGQTIRKTIGAKIEPPPKNVKRYYTIPTRKRGLSNLKRHTFASFDELLFYISKYEINFEDVEEYIEVEEFAPNSEGQEKIEKKITRERKRASKKRRRKRRR